MPVYLPGLAFGKGYGGSSYGYSPYGSGAYPRLPSPVTGGFGGAPYGYSSYGSLDIIPPRISGAVAINGYRLEIFFSEEMAGNAALFDAASYTISSVFGVPVTVTGVEGGTPGTSGWTSAVATHTGTTLGGNYTVSANGPEDISGNAILVTETPFFALGDEITATVGLPTPDDGRTVQVQFQGSLGPQPMLTEAQFSPGVNSPDSYAVTTDYPVAPTLSSPEQETTDLSVVDFDLHPMTSAEYDLTIGPALSIDYEGSVLPDDDPNFIGVEVGAGTSVPSSTGLFLSKSSADTYGWRFLDTSGRIVPGSTYRVDIGISFSAATIFPALLNTTFALVTVTDGGIQLNVTLEDVAGMKMLRVVSGALNQAAPANWDTESQITVVRNQKGGFYSILISGSPIMTFAIADATGVPTQAAGTSLTLLSGHSVTLFRLSSVDITASSTLFTAAWNFVHNLGVTFTGSGVLTRDRIFTKRGPLVRGWGDSTPATINDVEVRLDGGAIELAGVNPYVGEIYPKIPIPLASAGTFSVEVDYIWFMNPAMEVAGLNTRGLGLNIWDRAVGSTPVFPSPLPASSTGATKNNRFPMGVVLAPYTRPSPKQIAHKYIGFQKGGYSALLNEPTTLLLNKNPHSFSEGGISATSMVENGAFNGQTTPPNSETPWTLSGIDGGGVVGDGTYRVLDSSSGPYGIGDAAIWGRELDLSLNTSTTTVGRFRVESYSADGVFTGVGIGVHDGGSLVMVGAIEVSGFQHLGFLQDGNNPHLEASWALGPGAEAVASSQTAVEVPLSSFPLNVGSGSRVRVATGPQAGIYTIAECGAVSVNGSVELTFVETLPADVSLEGNNEFALYYEVPWNTELVSVRILAGFPGGTVSIFIGGSIGGTLVSGVFPIPYPAQTALLLPATEGGVVFWGSISRRAKSTSVWDLTQYVSEPERILQTVQGLTAFTEMNVVPEDDPNDPWYIVGGFGYSEVDATGDYTLLKSTSASASIDYEFSYERVEPFLNPRVYADLEAKFRIESGRLGAGDNEVRVNDGRREVTLSPLLYVQGVYTDPASGAPVTGRALVTDLPEASLSGLQAPSPAGWVLESSSGSFTPFVRGQTLELTKAALDQAFWSNELATPVMVGYEGLILEARVEVLSGTVGASGVGGIGLALGCSVPSSGPSRAVFLAFASGSVLLLDANYAEVASFAFAWENSGPHTYRVLIDPVADNVVLTVDDTVVGSTPFTGFLQVARDPSALFGAVSDGLFEAVLHSKSVTPLRPVALAGSILGRTFGILLRSGQDNPEDIDSYRIPRDDDTQAVNSSLTAVPRLMDWRDWSHVRVYKDPTWGALFFRPDMPLPPWYTGDFATESSDPSAAWVSVETSELPVSPEDRGYVKFGPINPEAITQVRYDFMRYRLRGDYDGFGLAPQNMVLNRAFTFTSGEFNIDTTPEVRTFRSRTPTLAVVSDSGVFADRVFVVQVDGAVLPRTSWAFNPDGQLLVFTSALSSAEHLITVTFAPGKPVTKEYLCSQPLNESITVLNEGTPPVPKSRDDKSTTQVVFGSQINDPSDVLDDAEAMVLNDPLRHIEYADPNGSFYTGVEFCETEEGESVNITPICDAPGPGHGLAEIAIEGLFTTDGFSVEEGPAGPWGKQSPVIRGSSAHFPQTSVLMSSGGGYLDGKLGPGTAVLYPNARAASGEALPSGSQMGMNQDFRMVISDETPREEVLDIPSLLGDNTPPSSADPSTDPNPDGAPSASGYGAAAYVLEDFSASPFSRLGPWLGLPQLSERSLLGGGAQLNGSEITLAGGAPLPIVKNTTTGVIEHP